MKTERSELSAEVQQRYEEGRLDLLVRIGRKHYPTWDAYVDESVRMGCCRRVPHLPQGIREGETLCFLYHDGGAKWEGEIKGFFIVKQTEIIVQDEAEAAKLRAERSEMRPVLLDVAVDEGMRGCGNRGVLGAMYVVSDEDFDDQWRRAAEASHTCELVGPLFIFNTPVSWPGRPSRGFSWVNGADILKQAEGVVAVNADTVCNWQQLGRGIRY